MRLQGAYYLVAVHGFILPILFHAVKTLVKPTIRWTSTLPSDGQARRPLLRQSQLLKTAAVRAAAPRKLPKGSSKVSGSLPASLM